MKKFILPFALLVFVACGGGNEKKASESTESTETTEASAANDPTESPVYKKGLAIELSQDCKTCHKIDEKLTGPAFKEIAAKYAGYSDTIVTHLADKVISGGTGVWGQVPMTPHMALSEDSAKAIVRYILMLNEIK